MPRGDRTGPMGMGPMSGRAAGYCAGYPTAGYANPMRAWTWWGGGRGWRHCFYATGLPGWLRFGRRFWGVPAPVPEPEVEKQFLTAQADWLQKELEAIKRRLEELEASGEQQ
ncbi:MAG: DUF5320 domain-containing protein [Calditrichaeota bacterium]|nr:DUF5320 domain-containing protein [Calditrichota bacterium]